MSTQSIQFNLSSLQFLTRRFSQFSRVHTAETPVTNLPLPVSQNNQPLLTNTPEKVVENHVVNGIGKAIGSDTVSPAKINDKEFTPDKIADRILAFVKKAYGEQQNNDPSFDKADFFTQVKQGIDAGFSSAREALDKQGVLTGQPEENLNAAYAKIQEGLTKLETGDPASTAPVTQLQGISAQIHQSAEVEIVTKEGDVVKISLAQSASNSLSSANIQQDGLTASAVQSSSESSSKFSISVDGNLNEDEQNAVKKLLKQIDNVGQDFFNGHVQDAFKHAQKIGLDSEQLASFSVDLSFDKSIQAVSAYQQAAFPDQPVEHDKIKKAADFFGQARDMLKTAQSALQPFEDPLSAFNALFDAVSKVGIDPSTKPKPADDSPSLQQIIQPVSESILGNEKPVPAPVTA
jgi:hypothetical protein